MKVRNISVHGILVWDDNWSSDQVEFEIGDRLFYKDTLYKCVNETHLNPDEDYYSWKNINPVTTSVDELLNGGSDATFTDRRAVYDALFGSNGVAKFLTPVNTLSKNADTYINSWGKNLSLIDHTSTYVVTIGAAEITDWPPLVHSDGAGIVNTLVIESETYQDLTSFDTNGVVLTYSIRIKKNGVYSEWSTVMMNNSTDETFNNFLVIVKMFRQLLKYHEQTAEKYTTIYNDNVGVSEYSPDYDNLPNYNILVQTKHDVLIDGVTKSLYKWIVVFKSDLDDSFSYDMILDSDDTYSLVCKNRILSTTNGRIVKVIKFIGNVTENPDGSDYFRFGYSE